MAYSHQFELYACDRRMRIKTQIYSANDSRSRQFGIKKIQKCESHLQFTDIPTELMTKMNNNTVQ